MTYKEYSPIEINKKMKPRKIIPSAQVLCQSDYEAQNATKTQKNRALVEHAL